jgi:hypothetical protein
MEMVSLSKETAAIPKETTSLGMEMVSSCHAAALLSKETAP